ncbi:MAG TPA: hypothetical protein VFW80_07210 [Gaiellaceae bacterium]|nr:hypothetical protein [Gaiellaceae bacterium]
MRRSVTLVLVVLVGSLGALAVADALRSGDDGKLAPASPPTTTTRPRAPTLVDTLRRAAVSGSVLYSDHECILHSLVLPQMVDEVIRDENGAGAFHACRFEVAGGRIIGEPSAEKASGLAFRHGRILAGDDTVLSRRSLISAAQRHPNLAFEGFDEGSPLHIRITGLARPTGREVIVAMSVRAHFVSRQFLAAIFRDRALVGVGFGGPYRHLFVSSDRSLVGAENGTIFMPHGRTVHPPDDLPSGRAVAFSPDDRWIARVNGISVFLFATSVNNGPAQILRLPVPAQDLVWEPGGVDPGAVVRAG